ncbi:MAG: DUF1579 family protein [Planctomycetota bacterium]
MRVTTSAICATVGIAAGLSFAAGLLLGGASGSTAPVAQEGQPQDMDAMMEAWMQAAAPDDHHKKMHYYLGTWKTEVKSLMPGGEAWTSAGTANFSMIMGGRFLKQDYRGDFMGMEMQGMGLQGYNKVNQRWESLWTDNMTTALHYSTGETTDKGWAYHGTETDPMTGETLKVKDELVKHGADHFTFTRYYPNPEAEGEMMPGFKIDYTRQAAGRDAGNSGNNGGNAMGGNRGR